MSSFCFTGKNSKTNSEMSLIENGIQLCEKEKEDKVSKDGVEGEDSAKSNAHIEVVVVERIKRSSTEWVFGLLSMFLLCACAVLAAELVLLLSRSKEDQKNQGVQEKSTFVAPLSFCVSSDCLHEASIISNKADFSREPCQDFYQFACGGFTSWLRTEVQHKQKERREAETKLKQLITEPITFIEPLAMRKVKIFYESCIDLVQIETRGVDPVKDIFQSVGGWPVIETRWRNPVLTWQELARRYQHANVSVNFFFEPRIAFDSGKHGLKISLGLSTANLGLPSLADEAINEEYYQQLVDAAILFGADNETAKEEMRYVFYFETLAKQKYWENFNLKEMRITKMTIYELQNLVPQVDWRTYINSFLPYTINYNDIIFVDTPSFLPKFAELLEETDTRTLANYAGARVIWSFAPLLSQQLKTITRATQVKQREQYCTEIVTKYFSIPLAGYYLRKYFDSEAKPKAQDIVSHVKLAYFITYDQMLWNYGLKHTLKQVMADVHTFVGYPEEMLNNSAVEFLYNNLLFDKKTFFENYRSVKKYFDKNLKYTRSGLSSFNNWDQNGGGAIASEVFYLPLTDTLYVPSIVIQEIYRVSKRPGYMNFATIGALVGKEFSKAISITEEKLDYPERDKKLQCLQKQYVNLTKQTVNGYTLPEYAKDFFNHFRGVQIGYSAYQLWTQKRSSIEQSLPGKNFNVNQLYWISYANMFCSDNLGEQSQIIAQHLVNLPLRNLPEFAEDFQCEEESLMNPTSRCSAW